jgi:DNA-binding MarR family transcriptional regulator
MRYHRRVNDDQDQIAELVERLGRLLQAEAWGDDLTPTQRAALAFLARANAFSRTPSAVADWLVSTRGTVSQTLLALEARGLVARSASGRDRRSVRFDLTEAGAKAALARDGPVGTAISTLAPERRERLAADLAEVVAMALARRGGRGFGLCRTCRFHERQGAASRCGLLGIPLAPADGELICREFEPA